MEVTVVVASGFHEAQQPLGVPWVGILGARSLDRPALLLSRAPAPAPMTHSFLMVWLVASEGLGVIL
jgi:hypothetical protein